MTATSRNRRRTFRHACAGGCLLALTACTPAQLEQWQLWHAQDPDAAIAYANTPDVQAQLASAVPAPGAPPSGRGGVWDRIARCESGGRWDHPPVTNRTGTYSGGLMIGHRWWPAYGGGEFAPYPYQASKAAQITVAENIAADVGLDPRMAVLAVTGTVLELGLSLLAAAVIIGVALEVMSEVAADRIRRHQDAGNRRCKREIDRWST